jgi:hypothetical protein
MTKTTAQHDARRARKIRSVRGVVATYLHEISTGDRRKPELVVTAPVATEPVKA